MHMVDSHAMLLQYNEFVYIETPIEETNKNILAWLEVSESRINEYVI